jgi:HK97 gp10 family phage protein
MIGEETHPFLEPEWPALSENTIARKARGGYLGQVSSTDPLLRTGELKNSIRGRTFGLVGILGSNSGVANHHEFGTSRMPPRPFIGPAMKQAVAESDDLVRSTLEYIFRDE